MIDLDRELRALDEISTPDLRAGVRPLRGEGPDDDRSPFARGGPTRITVIATVTVICLVAGGLVWRAFMPRNDRRPAAPDVVDVENGDIWVGVGGGDGATAIWRVDAEGGTEPLWADSAGVFTGAPVEPGLIADDYAFSPDGTRVAFSAEVREGSGGAPTELFVMDADGTRVRQLTDDGAYAGFPAWSPDGTTIAYASYQGTDYIPGCLGTAICPADLRLTNASGGSPVTLIGSEASETTPTWSPDGTRIAYAEVGEDGSGTLVIIGVDGSDRVEIGPRGVVSFPAWSPDGERLLFLRWQDGTLHLWTVSPDGSSLNDVADTRVDTNFGRPLWSPEGDHIVFARPYAGVVSIWLVDPAGDGPPERIAGWPGFDAAPIAWRPAPHDAPRIAPDRSSEPASDDIHATCGSVQFPGTSPDPSSFSPLASLDDLNPNLASTHGVVPFVEFAEVYEWYVAQERDGIGQLFGRTEVRDVPRFAYATLELTDEGWTPRGFGGCSIELTAEGWGTASFVVDPDEPPDAAADAVSVLATERACASGEPPVGRDVQAVVVAEDEESISVVILVEPEGGDCPSNPAFPFVVPLGEPLGDRTILDASTYPPEARWP